MACRSWIYAGPAIPEPLAFPENYWENTQENLADLAPPDVTSASEDL
jgi:hypothetical protein